MEALITFVYISWFSITLLCQRQTALANAIRARDVFSIIPVWTFFAPNPEVLNFHLLYRDLLPDGKYTPFLEITLCNHSMLRTLWYPKRRHWKVLVDVVHTLTHFSNASSEERRKVEETLPYIILANYVSNLPHTPEAIGTQFAIFSAQGQLSEDQKLVLLSKNHSLKA